MTTADALHVTRRTRVAHQWRPCRSPTGSLGAPRVARSRGSPKKGSESGLPRPYPSWLVKAQVERRRWDDPEVAAFLKRGEPIVVTDLPLCQRLVNRWTYDYVAKHHEGTASTHFVPRTTTRVTRFYGDGAGEGGILSMRFRDFVEVARKNERLVQPTWRYYLQMLLMWSHNKMAEGAEAEMARERL